MALSPAGSPEPRIEASTVLRISGPDALGFLHRLSTQALEDLEPGRCRATLFCDFRGRLIHRAIVARTSDGGVWVVRDDAPSAELASYLAGFVFRDRVEIEDRGAALHARFLSIGAGSAGDLVEERDGIPDRVVVGPGMAFAIGPGPALVPVDPEREERERIRAGRPRHGHEIAPAFTPFEVGLAHEVHLSKGCFTGQEALMRLVTYRSVRRRLVLIEGTGSPPPTPTPLVTEAVPAGVLTSAARDGDGWVGLGVVPLATLEPGQSIAVAEAGAILRTAPFPQRTPLGLP